MNSIAIKDLVIVKQIPVIEEHLRKLSTEIDEKLSIVDGLICTEDSVKDIKKIRAGFNRDFAEIEEIRKTVKMAVLTPYEAFEKVYKEYVGDKYKAAESKLKTKITEVENELKAKKKAEIKVYFDEYAAANGVSEYADFDRQMSDQAMSQTIKAFQRICRERIDPLISGLQAIDTQPEESRAEILAEFKKCLSASEAITIVSNRHKAIEAQKKAQAEREARQAAEAETVAKVEEAIPQPLAPPVAVPIEESDPIIKVSFTVTAQKSKLLTLKKYLIDGGYQYE